MDIETASKAYVAALGKGDFEALKSLFTEDARVDAPLYGVRPAAEFYRHLVDDTREAALTLQGIYHDIERPGRGIVHFRMRWTLKNGDVGEFDAIDIIDLENGKIKYLKIVFDTFLAPAGAPEQAATHGVPSRLAVLRQRDARAATATA